MANNLYKTWDEAKASDGDGTVTVVFPTLLRSPSLVPFSLFFAAPGYLLSNSKHKFGDTFRDAKSDADLFPLFFKSSSAKPISTSDTCTVASQQPCA